MNNGPIAGLIAGCVIYLCFRVISQVARVMFIGRHDRLNWEKGMAMMEIELLKCRVRAKSRVDYLRYYRGTA